MISIHLYEKIRREIMKTIKTRRNFSKDFKLQLCKDMLSGLQTNADLSRQYQIPKATLSRWLNEYIKFGEKEAFVGQGSKRSEISELQNLKKENERLKIENEILKKLQAYYPNPKEKE